MSKLTIYVTAYDRQDMLNVNIEPLEHRVIVFDDHSPIPLKSRYEVVRAERNHGKQDYWQWVTVLLRRAQQESGHVLITADDISMQPGAIEYAVQQLESLPAPSMINLLNDGRPKCWNNIMRQPLSRHLYRAGFVDGCFIAHREAMDVVGWYINPILSSRWRGRNRLGSGVWQQFTYRANSHGVGIYQLRQRWFMHGPHESKMNPEERRRKKLL